MSIYGGFGLRKTETRYNWCLEQILGLLSNKVINIIEKEPEEDLTKFKYKFGKVYCMMRNMEEHKYLPPKFSECVKKLVDFIGIDTELFENQASTINGSIMEHFNDKQSTRLNTSQTPPKSIKIKTNNQSSSQIKELKTPNASTQRKRQLSSSSYQYQNAITSHLEKLSERASIKTPEQSVMEDYGRQHTNQNIQSIDNQNLKTLDKLKDQSNEGKQKEQMNKIQKNKQDLFQYENQKLRNSSYNPYARNYSPTLDHTNRGNKQINSTEKAGYTKQWNSRHSIGNNHTFYASKAFIYDNKKEYSKNQSNKNSFNVPNINESIEERINSMKKQSTKPEGERNASVGTSHTTKNNSSNTTIEQTQMYGSDKKQFKNIRMKKQKIVQSKKDSNSLVYVSKENGKDNYGNRLPSLSPQQKNKDLNADLLDFIESKYVYKEKETLNLANLDQKDNNQQNVRVKDVLMNEEQIKNDDKKKMHS